jgi:hypothetical protein
MFVGERSEGSSLRRSEMFVGEGGVVGSLRRSEMFLAIPNIGAEYISLLRSESCGVCGFYKHFTPTE